jgi:hypothetical protein
VVCEFGDQVNLVRSNKNRGAGANGNQIIDHVDDGALIHFIDADMDVETVETPVSPEDPTHATAASSLPSSVQISVRSPHQRTSARCGGVKSRRSASSALRADLSGGVLPRRLRLRRATRPFKALSLRDKGKPMTATALRCLAVV